MRILQQMQREAAESRAANATRQGRRTCLWRFRGGAGRPEQPCSTRQHCPFVCFAAAPTSRTPAEPQITRHKPFAATSQLRHDFLHLFNLLRLGCQYIQSHHRLILQTGGGSLLTVQVRPAKASMTCGQRLKHRHLQQCAPATPHSHVLNRFNCSLNGLWQVLHKRGRSNAAENTETTARREQQAAISNFNGDAGQQSPRAGSHTFVD